MEFSGAAFATETILTRMEYSREKARLRKNAVDAI